MGNGVRLALTPSEDRHTHRWESRAISIQAYQVTVKQLTSIEKRKSNIQVINLGY